MRKQKAIAIAVQHQTSVNALLDFMYGTPERTRLTVVFAFALLTLGMILNASPLFAGSVCPV